MFQSQKSGKSKKVRINRKNWAKLGTTCIVVKTDSTVTKGLKTGILGLGLIKSAPSLNFFNHSKEIYHDNFFIRVK
jgi:hypothetical protein